MDLVSQDGTNFLGSNQVEQSLCSVFMSGPDAVEHDGRILGQVHPASGTNKNWNNLEQSGNSSAVYDPSQIFSDECDRLALKQAK